MNAFLFVCLVHDFDSYNFFFFLILLLCKIESERVCKTHTSTCLCSTGCLHTHMHTHMRASIHRKNYMEKNPLRPQCLFFDCLFICVVFFLHHYYYFYIYGCDAFDLLSRVCARVWCVYTRKHDACACNILKEKEKKMQAAIRPSVFKCL